MAEDEDIAEDIAASNRRKTHEKIPEEGEEVYKSDSYKARGYQPEEDILGDVVRESHKELKEVYEEGKQLVGEGKQVAGEIIERGKQFIHEKKAEHEIREEESRAKQAYSRKKKIEELKLKVEEENEKAYIKRLEHEANRSNRIQRLKERLKGEGESSPFKSAIHGRKEEQPFWMRGSDTGRSGIMAAIERGEPARYMSPSYSTGQRQPAQRGQTQQVIVYDPVLRRRVVKRVYVGEQQPQPEQPRYITAMRGEGQSHNSVFMSAVLSGPRQEQRQYEPRQHKSMLQDAMFGGHGQNLPKEHRSALMSAITQPKSIYESEHESPLRKAMEGKKGFKL